MSDADSAGLDRATLDKRRGDVAAMFDRVAERYDLANDVLSLGQDRAWRKQVTEAVAPRPGQLILDLAAGTGTSSEPFARRGATVIPTDLSFGMLLVGKQRRPSLSFVAADALQLPYADASFDAVTISFGAAQRRGHRSCPDRDAAGDQAGRHACRLRVLHAQLATVPHLYSNYLVAALPRIASLVSSNPAAYEYLAESIQAWPDQQGLAAMIEKCRLAGRRVAQSVRRHRRSASGPVMINVESTAVTAPPGTILLGAYAARSCPVKTQNAFNPTVVLEDADAKALRSRPMRAAELFDGGAQFEAAGARAADHLLPRTGCRSSATVVQHPRGADRSLCPGHELRRSGDHRRLPAC